MTTQDTQDQNSKVVNLADYFNRKKEATPNTQFKPTKEIFETTIELTFSTEDENEFPYWFTHVSEVNAEISYISCLCLVDTNITFWERLKIFFNLFREQSRRLKQIKKQNVKKSF